MQIMFRSKYLLDGATTKKELIALLQHKIWWLQKLPDDVKVIRNVEDDYIYLEVDPKDKDDRKYFKSLGFTRDLL
jgi:hypothetical protein|tara:strand:- start:94 stop:318 length:225 start_codon:yes stop_codon:yes gene_type:complete